MADALHKRGAVRSWRDGRCQVEPTEQIATLQRTVDALHSPEYLAEQLVSRMASDGFPAGLVTIAEGLLETIRSVGP